MTHAVTKEVGQAVAAEIKQAVEEVLKRHNLTTAKINHAYGEWFEFKIQATPIEEGLNGVNLASREATYYKKFGWVAFLGNGSDDQALTAPIGTIFTNGDKKYVFAGVDPKKKKYPIVAFGVGTTETVFFAETIIGKINKAALVAEVDAR